MNLSIFNRRERYKRDVQLLEKIYEDKDIDIKLKKWKIQEGVRKIYPVLEFEGEGIEKFNEVFEKIRNAEIGKNLTALGYGFIFPVSEEFVNKRKTGQISENYNTAIISPFPDNLRYEPVKIKKNLNVKAGDYIFIKKGFINMFVAKTGFTERILYIDEAEAIEKVKAYKISQNLLSDFKDKIQAMLPQETEKEEEKLAASVLSAGKGLGLFSIVYDQNAVAGISKIYKALQNSLPEIFRNEKIYLNFNSPRWLNFKKNSLKITLEGMPLFEGKNFETHPQQSLWFENAYANQTIASPRIFGKITDARKSREEVLSLYRNANLINEFKFYEPFYGRGKYAFPELKLSEEPIYDEEISFWLISQRNLYSYAFGDAHVDTYFKKKFANVIQENLNLSLSEGLLNLAIENTIIKESMHRGFESFCRKGDTDSTENAKKFIDENLKEMSNFSTKVGEEFRMDLEKREKKRTKLGERIYDSIINLVEITGRLPYDELVNGIKKDIKCDEQRIKDVLDFINKTHSSIRIRDLGGIKVVEFK